MSQGLDYVTGAKAPGLEAMHGQPLPTNVLPGKLVGFVFF